MRWIKRNRSQNRANLVILGLLLLVSLIAFAACSNNGNTPIPQTKTNPAASNNTIATGTPTISGTSTNPNPIHSLANTKISYENIVDGNRQIFTMNSDGSGVTQLTKGLYPNFAPAWSGDGAKIAFASIHSGVETVWVMKPDGSGQGQITKDQPPRIVDNIAYPVNNENPSWSPDGTRIAYYSTNLDPRGSMGIFIMKADGSNPTRLVITNQGDFIVPQSAPVWSPDGSKIAFVSSRDQRGSQAIETINPDGSAELV